jgi:SRSO17 transposase
VTRGQSEAPRYYGSNLPTSASLEELAGLAHRRHAIEPFHEEASGELGWDPYQGRLWPGSHRHAVTVRLAYSVLVWRERQPQHHPTRQGCPRGPFSPSAAAPATITPGRAS